MPPPRKPRPASQPSQPAPAALSVLAPLPSPAEGEAPPPANRIAATAAVTLADAASVAELVIDSPIGPLLLVADDRALCAVYFPNHPDGAVLREVPAPGAAAARVSEATPAAQHILHDTARQLGEYFAGTRREFELPLETGGTGFQQQVWRALCEIPFAVTWSYGQLATSVGNRNASRAVGAANGKNPIPIIVPCHRVIGSNGSLTGFGGGEATKRWLLDHEAKVAGLRLF